MPFDGSGVFRALPPPTYPAVAGETVRADYFNSIINDIIAGLTAAYTSSSTVNTFLQAGTGAITRTPQNKMREVISVADFGAIGDGVADDLAAINLAIAYVNGLGNVNRFYAGARLIFPNATYKISAALTAITSSNVVLEGSSHGGTVILGATNCTYDLVTFDGSALALYNVGVKNIRFYTPGNATAGAHIRATRCINAEFSGIHCMAAFDAVVLDGCAKTILDTIIFSQENRTAGTSPRYAFDFKATNFVCSDIHVTNCNVVTDTVNNPDTNSLSIRGADGIYFSNCHGFGCVLIQPAVSGVFPAGPTCASVKFVSYYYDQSVANNVKFTGTSAAYRDFEFIGCKFRASGGNGLEFNAASTINRVKIIGGDFDGHRLYAIYGLSTVNDLIVIGVTFNNNNTDNTAGVGDVYCTGKMTLSACRLIGGGALGTAIQLTAASSDCIIANNSLAASTAGTPRITNAGTGNKIRGNTGHTTSNQVTVTILNGATTGSIAHGLNITPSTTSVILTPSSVLHGAISARCSATSATTLTITSEAAVSADTTWVATIPEL